jgi:hypothetical protein
VPTTIRSAVTKLQNPGERVTGIALNAADAQNLDLLRWTSGDGGFLTGGYATDNRQQTFGSSDNIFGGPDAQRIISPNVPAGICFLGDWTTLAFVLPRHDAHRHRDDWSRGRRHRPIHAERVPATR